MRPRLEHVAPPQILRKDAFPVAAPVRVLVLVGRIRADFPMGPNHSSDEKRSRRAVT